MRRAHRIPNARGAFTLMELLVVMGLILVLLALAVPAATSMQYSSNRALAGNALQSGVSLARDVAIASARGGDGVAVFLFEPEGGMRIVAGEVVGGVDLQTGFGLDPSHRAHRDLIAPVASTESVQLPRFWSVRGYAPPNAMLPPPGNQNVDWYDSVNYGGDSQTAQAKRQGNWVFPESGFYDVTRQTNGTGGGGGSAGLQPGPTARQSFMVRFNARTGSVSQVDSSALFVDPRPSDEGRDQIADRRTNSDAWKRVDWAENVGAWTTRTLARYSQDFNGDGRYDSRDQADFNELLGDSSNDTVLVKGVRRLALHDERRLARGLGGALNTRTDSLYAPYAEGDRISFDTGLFPGRTIEEIRQGINDWIEGDTNRDGEIDEEDEPDSRLYLLEAYSGGLTEVQR